MAIQLRQVFKWGAFSGTAQNTTQTITPTSAFLPGDIAVVAFTFDTAHGVSAITVGDPTNGGYTQLGTLNNDVTHGQATGWFYKENVAAGSPTITVSYSGTGVDFPAAAVGVITGARTSGSLSLGSDVGQLQAASGTATDGATSGLGLNIIGQPALILELCMASSSAATPAAGTGFTSSSSGWVSGISLATAAAMRVTSVGQYAGTFKMSTSGSTQTFVAAFLELNSSNSSAMYGLEF